MNMNSNQLATPRPRLAALEAIIERGMQAFIEVGHALRTIRDTRMYREQRYKTFDEYCRARWHWSKTHANRQIQAAQAAETMTPMGVIPANERQARQMRQRAQGEVDTTASLYFSLPLAATSCLPLHPAYANRSPVDSESRKSSRRQHSRPRPTPSNSRDAGQVGLSLMAAIVSLLVTLADVEPLGSDDGTVARHGTTFTKSC